MAWGDARPIADEASSCVASTSMDDKLAKECTCPLSQFMKPFTAGLLAVLVVPMVHASSAAFIFPLSGELSVASAMGTFAVIYLFASLSLVLFGLPVVVLLERLRLVSAAQR